MVDVQILLLFGKKFFSFVIFSIVQERLFNIPNLVPIPTPASNKVDGWVE